MLSGLRAPDGTHAQREATGAMDEALASFIEGALGEAAQWSREVRVKKEKKEKKEKKAKRATVAIVHVEKEARNEAAAEEDEEGEAEEEGDGPMETERTEEARAASGGLPA